MRVLAPYGRLAALPPGLAAVEEARVVLDLPQWEQREDEIPRHGARLVLPLAVVRLVPA